MSRRTQLLREGKLTFLLALPLMVAQISQMLIGLADTLMLGRLGEVTLAAGAFGITLLLIPLLFGVGIAVAVSVKTSQARGAQQPHEAREALRQGMYLALALGILTVIAAIALVPFLGRFGQDEAAVALMPTFFVIYAFSCIPELLTMCLRNQANAMNRPWPAFWIIIGGVVLNIILNYLLIFGNLGFPRWELEGAAVAAVITRVCTFIGLMIWICKAPGMRDWIPQKWFARVDWRHLGGLIKLGLPTGIQVVCEAGAFSAALLIVGTISAQAVAAHQVVITCAGIVFMIPLGLSMASTVRIGQAIGARELPRIRIILYSSSIIGFCLFLLTAQLFLFFNDELASLFLPGSDAQPIAAKLFLIAALFQLTDYLQVLCSGALRGLNDVNYSATATFVAYWIISLPLGYVLAFYGGLGVYGIWWGLVLGICLCAIALTVRAMYKTRTAALAALVLQLDLNDTRPGSIR